MYGGIHYGKCNINPCIFSIDCGIPSEAGPSIKLYQTFMTSRPGRDLEALAGVWTFAYYSGRLSSSMCQYWLVLSNGYTNCRWLTVPIFRHPFGILETCEGFQTSSWYLDAGILCCFVVWSDAWGRCRFWIKQSSTLEDGSLMFSAETAAGRIGGISALSVIFLVLVTSHFCSLCHHKLDLEPAGKWWRLESKRFHPPLGLHGDLTAACILKPLLCNCYFSILKSRWATQEPHRSHLCTLYIGEICHEFV